MSQTEYLETISAIKSEIKGAQYRAVLGANRELITLYWRIGQVINTHKTWGNKFVENLAADMKLEFPNVTGYSVRNLKYKAKFAAKYTDEEFMQQVVAQIPWGQNVVLLDKVSDDAVRHWYTRIPAQANAARIACSTATASARWLSASICRLSRSLGEAKRAAFGYSQPRAVQRSR